MKITLLLPLLLLLLLVLAGVFLLPVTVWKSQTDSPSPALSPALRTTVRLIPNDHWHTWGNETGGLHLCDWAHDIESKLCRNASTNALVKMGQYLRESRKGEPFPPQNPFHHSAAKIKDCTVKRYGEISGYHFVCNNLRPVNTSCVFYAYGVSSDWTFDDELSRSWDCRGILMDPSVNYKAILTERLLFFSLGATMLRGERGGAGAWQGEVDPNGWLTAAPSELMRMLGHESIAVLKMDCEGCEYAIVPDLVRSNPDFFKSVTQFAVEVHLSRNWIKSPQHTFNLGMLFHILFKEGYYLVAADIGACAPADESKGCPSELTDLSFPCGQRQMCQEYTFARLLLLDT
ncbi:hypothetical protein B484DRAFT_400741 [Ochromonadaceae sp. CCMP2298]|nr:hypothetical protein B484DRAFT_400741 [Ochromonadaceae sp. CCMP2298]